MKTKDFYNVPDEKRWGREVLPQYNEIFSQLLSLYVQESSIVVELGCGKGFFKNCHPNYIGIDLSYTVLKKYFYQKKCIQADIERIPLKDGKVSFVFSIATLEHLPNPENCLKEIHRILAPGGIIFLHPAWFCRAWACEGLPIKRYNELNWRNKLNKMTIPIRENLFLRGINSVCRRIFWEIRYTINPSPISFRYRKLNPRLQEYIYPDCDAFVSMDPHMVIMYFLSRGYQCLSNSSFFSRIFVRHTPVILRKR
jgi:SAM-dependent methyltransferase